MPREAIRPDATTEARLEALGNALQARREALGLTAATTARAAGISRVTLHRIERGRASVAVGAFLAVAAALGLEVAVVEPDLPIHADGLPARIALADYPQLAKLAWQRPADAVVTPIEAFALYERNARHLDRDAMTEGERVLLDRLTRALGKGRLLVRT